MTRRGTYEIHCPDGSRWAVPIVDGLGFLAARGGEIVGFISGDLSATPMAVRIDAQPTHSHTQLDADEPVKLRAKRKRGSS